MSRIYADGDVTVAELEVAGPLLIAGDHVQLVNCRVHGDVFITTKHADRILISSNMVSGNVYVNDSPLVDPEGKWHIPDGAYVNGNIVKTNRQG